MLSRTAAGRAGQMWFMAHFWPVFRCRENREQLLQQHGLQGTPTGANLSMFAGEEHLQRRDY